MKNFEYAAPRSEAAVLELLSADVGHTELLAGGTDLVPLLTKMILTPERVVYIKDIPSIGQIERDSVGNVRIGAAVALDDLLESPLLAIYPAITQAITGISSMQLQAQGTLGGELCQRAHCWFFRNGYGLLADAGRIAAEGDNRFHAIFGNSGPAKFVSGSRLAPALIALGAQVRVLGPKPEDEKLIALADLYRTPRHEGERETVLEPNQWVTHVIVPPSGGNSATYEVRHGEGPDYPLAAASVSLTIVAGRVEEARVVLGQVAPTPWTSAEAAVVLIGRSIDENSAAEAGAAAVAAATPLSGNEYKVQLAQVAVKRAVLLAAGLETGGF